MTAGGALNESCRSIKLPRPQAFTWWIVTSQRGCINSAKRNLGKCASVSSPPTVSCAGVCCPPLMGITVLPREKHDSSRGRVIRGQIFRPAGAASLLSQCMPHLFRVRSADGPPFFPLMRHRRRGADRSWGRTRSAGGAACVGTQDMHCRADSNKPVSHGRSIHTTSIV